MRVFTTRRLGGAAAAVAILATAVAILHSQRENGSSRSIVDATPAIGAGSIYTPARRAGVANSHGAHTVDVPPTVPAAARPAGVPVSVAVAARPSGRAAPDDFLGLSFEERDLPLIAGYARAAAAGSEDFVVLLRSLGAGVMRFGGVSADEQVAWLGAGGAKLPGWASVSITSIDLEGLAVVARESGWRVLLTVNLGHYDPAAAAQEAAAARAALGSSLAGIEIGNEPDRYVGRHLRARGWDFAAYRSQAQAYRAAIARAAPGVPIAGPDPSTGAPNLGWLRAAARALHPQLLTDHYYPLSSCGYRPTIGELLSASVRGKESAALAGASAIARAAATPLRLDEVNSVSCEGFRGTSDTFASALWALDYSARAIAAGAAGVNFHDLLTKTDAYSPLLAASAAALAAGELHAAPEWYALLAAHELSGSRPLRTRVEGATSEQLSASAFRASDGRLRILLLDYEPRGSQPLAVRLQVSRRYAGGSVLRLTAPSPAATTGVRLGGRAVAPDGSWEAPAALPAVYSDAGRLSVQIDPASAAVVTLPRR
jgi:hypothetical protein